MILSFTSHCNRNHRGFNILMMILTFLIMNSCTNDDSEIQSDASNTDADTPVSVVNAGGLPPRGGSRPETTMGIPHIQIGVGLVHEVNEELFRRVYSLPGIENRPSVIAGWRGMWISDTVAVVEPQALIDGREFGHIHDDGSLHIFLEPSRADAAVATSWGIFHPFAVQGLDGWDGFVMLYTPQSIDELNVTFQLIVDGYNYVTGQNLIATDYY